MDYFQQSAKDSASVNFEMESKHDFVFEKTDYSITEADKFNISEDEIIDMALKYAYELSPISDLYVVDIGLVSRKELNADGSTGDIEILTCEIIAVPMINDLPIYSQDMSLHVQFDNEDVIIAECYLPTNLDSFRVSDDTNFSEDILQNNVLTAFDNSEVRQAYYITEDHELIPIYIAECLTNEDVKIFKADSGTEITF